MVPMVLNQVYEWFQFRHSWQQWVRLPFIPSCQLSGLPLQVKVWIPLIFLPYDLTGRRWRWPLCCAFGHLGDCLGISSISRQLHSPAGLLHSTDPEVSLLFSLVPVELFCSMWCLQTPIGCTSGSRPGELIKKHMNISNLPLCRLQATKALGKNAGILGGSIMVGVAPCRDESVLDSLNTRLEFSS